MCDGGMCATVFREIGFPGQAREHKCLNNLLLLSFHGQLWIAKNRQIEVMAVGEIGKSYPGKALRDRQYGGDTGSRSSSSDSKMYRDHLESQVQHMASHPAPTSSAEIG